MTNGAERAPRCSGTRPRAVWCWPRACLTSDPAVLAGAEACPGHAGALRERCSALRPFAVVSLASA